MLPDLRCVTERENQLLSCQTVTWGEVKSWGPWKNAKCSGWEKLWTVGFCVQPWISWHLQQRSGLQSHMWFAWCLVRKRWWPTNVFRVSITHAAGIGAWIVRSKGRLEHASRLHGAYHRKRDHFYVPPSLISGNCFSWFLATSLHGKCKWIVIE